MIAARKLSTTSTASPSTPSNPPTSTASTPPSPIAAPVSRRFFSSSAAPSAISLPPRRSPSSPASVTACAPATVCSSAPTSPNPANASSAPTMTPSASPPPSTSTCSPASIANSPADFDLSRFAHEARWNERQSSIEMHLRSRVAQTRAYRRPRPRHPLRRPAKPSGPSPRTNSAPKPSRVIGQAQRLVACVRQWVEPAWGFAETLFRAAPKMTLSQ